VESGLGLESLFSSLVFLFVVHQQHFQSILSKWVKLTYPGCCTRGGKLVGGSIILFLELMASEILDSIFIYKQ
jgi:hypothetical protein